jgi:hypothetical protein
LKAFSNEETSQTSWNSSQESLRRLGGWLWNAALYRLQGQFLMWKTALDNAYEEILPKLTDDEEKDCEKLQKDLNKAVTKFHEDVEENNSDYTKIKSDLPSLLDEWSKKLRKCATKHGMLITDKESSYQLDADRV